MNLKIELERGTSSQSRLLGVVLCGGRSTRMGRDKAELTTPSGHTFLEIACRRLRSRCDQVCVSSSRQYATQHHRIADPTESHGPISGVYASLLYAQQCQMDACVINPVDTPELSVVDIDELIKAFDHHGESIICAVSKSEPERLEPLIAVYPVGFLTEIRDAIQLGRYGLQRILGSMQVIRVSLSDAACRNFNTPSDLHHLSADE